jgi:hypothetical protein
MIYGMLEDGNTFLGLSERNIEQLREGKPVHCECVGMPTLVIFSAKTDQDMMDSMVRQGMLDPADYEPGDGVSKH